MFYNLSFHSHFSFVCLSDAHSSSPQNTNLSPLHNCKLTLTVRLVGRSLTKVSLQKHPHYEAYGSSNLKHVHIRIHTGFWLGTQISAEF